MSRIIDEVHQLYRVIQFDDFRKTPGVVFDMIPVHMLGTVSAVDRVLHQPGAMSPGRIGDVQQPWYMHTHQDDNLIVLSGTRYVDIYTPGHGMIEQFTVTPTSVCKNGELIAEGGAMLVWPRYVFHRVVSGEAGSASINLAVHYDGFDIKTNFNIYDVDLNTGEHYMIREGYKDQSLY